MKTKRYKLRSECFKDIADFLEIFKSKRWGIKIEQQFLPPGEGPEIDEFQQTGIPIPDCELEFSTRATFDEIVAALKKVPDGHVMWQTVKPIDEYTGDRIYEM